MILIISYEREVPQFETGMKITHFLYNAFLIESGDKKIAIDPGGLIIKLGPFSKTLKPGPEERIGWGAIGFRILLDGKIIVNLGDTLLHNREWKSINNCDILMIPIGGRAVHNTMDVPEALQALQIMKPKLVIPCHYNCPAFFSETFNPADEDEFRKGVEELGMQCSILHKGESISV